jgi:hypothetical protein
LAREWRSRRWRRLLNLIDHLPGHSAYAEALAADEVLAEVILAQPEPPDRFRGPRVSEWTPERAALAEISDKLSVLIATTVAAAGSKPPKVTPSPRPQVAADAVRERRRIEQHLRLVDMVLPDRDRADAEFRRLAQLEQPGG